ncbi:MAG: ABC transporter ATP-binding protein [Solirubrobacteraceae bacterium]
MTGAVISVHGLRKAYGGSEAVRGIDLEVRAGEIFAFLGPNGAGKTTTVEILEGYRKRSAGEVRVLGVDPERATRDWRARIGVVLQTVEQDELLTVRETLEEYAGYYPAPRGVDRTLGDIGLADQGDQRVGSLSGGQQRRLDVGLALIGDPELLFLDEPTTGFDPSARRGAWALVGGLRDLGKTVFLTTHYMDEAQALADRVAVIAHGEIVATGTPAQLGGRGEAPSLIRFTPPPGAALPPGVEIEDGRAVLRTPEPVPALHALTAWALEDGHALRDLEVARPTLEDIYLQLTEGR